MRPFKTVGILLFSIAGVIASLLVIGSLASRPPKESKITSDFRAHRAAYEQMRAMLLGDKSVDVVADWGVLANGSLISHVPPDGGMPLKRYQEYLALFKDTGALAAARMQQPLETRFAVWGSGFAGDTRHVAVSWLDHEPPNTASSLAAFYETPKPRSPAYVPIEGNWYIWADW